MIVFSVIVGLLVALGWGIADFASKKLVDDVGPYGAMIPMQIIVSGLVISIVLLFGSGTDIDVKAFFFMLIGNIFSTAAWFTFYQALSIGYASVLFPLYTLYTLIPFAWEILLGELQITLMIIAGACLLLFAAILISTNLKELKEQRGKALARGVKEVMLANLFLGICLIFYDQAFKQTDWMTGYFYQEIVALVIVPVFLVIFGKIKQTKIPKEPNWLILAAILYTVAWFAMNLGIEQGHTGIVTLISSFSVAMTTALSWLFLKERLVLNQYIGIVLGIAGIILLSL